MEVKKQANSNEVLETILSDISGSTAVKTDDNILLETAEKEEYISDPQYQIRNELYSNLLSEYINSYSSKAIWKKWYKFSFFIITMLCFLGIITASCIALVFVARKGVFAFTDFGVILGSVAGIVSSLLIIPKIIAEHLFPQNEDTNMIELVKNMQLNDSRIRKDSKSSQKR